MRKDRRHKTVKRDGRLALLENAQTLEAGPQRCDASMPGWWSETCPASARGEILEFPYPKRPPGGLPTLMSDTGSATR
jgi:hypothetical protein